MKKVLIGCLILSSINLFSEDFYNLDNNQIKNAAKINVPTVREPVGKNSNNHEEKSIKGFCSQEQAVYRLFEIADRGEVAKISWGKTLIEGYADKLDKSCSLYKYSPTVVTSKDSNIDKITECWTLSDVCGTSYKLYGKKLCVSYQKDSFKNQQVRDEISKITNYLLKVKREIIQDALKELKEEMIKKSKEIIEEKIEESLKENPNGRVKIIITHKDVFKLRKEIARETRNPVVAGIDSFGELAFNNYDYLKPIINLNGPVGYVFNGISEASEEAYQCNISVKNVIAKLSASGVNYFVAKIPLTNNILKNIPINAGKAVINEKLSHWIKHEFGENIHIKEISKEGQYLLLGLETVFLTGENFHSH
ncbi:MAG: hypothetical protein N2Z60_03990 [Elusimicrobiales bacterium]|nr:hypothetical protein [Elusimicrobiales bacterium]